MKNFEKYKTADERARVFDSWCHTRGGCNNCVLRDKGLECASMVCAIHWLDLEAEEEKPMPCPFCGGECRIVKNKNDVFVVGCDYCCYASQDFDREQDAIAAHNRVCKAVAAFKESEAAK